MLPATQENGPADMPIKRRLLATGVRMISKGLMVCPCSLSHVSVSMISWKTAMATGSEISPFELVWATTIRASSR